ncbi:hypothetical protein LCGC14_0596000 [marine sediment metagenome]|uniref:Uncharacterized protein n=1 Tax=marine sediment metagenome TaxID=412755 RepID=A0A0F9RBW9_9ZZZZ
MGVRFAANLEYISDIFLILGFYSLYLHYESLSSTRPSFWRHLIVYGLAISCITILLLSIVAFYPDKNSAEILIHITSSIFGVASLLYPLHITLQTHRLTNKRATHIELISIFLFLISCVIYVGEGLIILFENVSLNPIIDFSEDISNLLFIIALVLLMINYLIHSDYLYQLPFPIHQIMIINKGGILIYNRKVSMVKIPNLNIEREIIMGGFISAIFSVVKEALGSFSQIKYIDTGKYKIYFSQIPGNNGIVSLIASGGNLIIQKSLDRFTKSIDLDIINKISTSGEINEDMVHRIDNFLIKEFSFLTIL